MKPYESTTRPLSKRRLPRTWARKTLAGLIALGLATSAGAQNAELIILDELTATAVSNGGGVVVGDVEMHDVPQAMMWTTATGMTPMAPEFRLANDLTSNGRTVVGAGNLAVAPVSIQAYRWSGVEGVEWLGYLPGGTESTATGISGRGDVIVGYGNTLAYAGLVETAFRWTPENGIEALIDNPQTPGLTNDLQALAVSHDGNVVVGGGFRVGEVGEGTAFRWTVDQGISGLGDLPGGKRFSVAYAASGNGRVIVGASSSANVAFEFSEDATEAFRWTAAEGMVGLGALPEGFFNSAAHDISADGRIIVGTGASTLGNGAFVWTEETGMMDLMTVLDEGGADARQGVYLSSATAISDDGRWVVGFGSGAGLSPKAFLARLPDSLLSDHFVISPDLNDSWYDRSVPGQGFFITVFPESRLVSISWLTWDTNRPAASIPANLGDPGHRWLTALGPYEGNRAVLDIYLTRGGVFDSASPAVTETPDGTIELTFIGCNNATLAYDVPSIGRSGEMEITRVSDENVADCEYGGAR